MREKKVALCVLVALLAVVVVTMASAGVTYSQHTCGGTMVTTSNVSTDSLGYTRYYGTSVCTGCSYYSYYDYVVAPMKWYDYFWGLFRYGF